MFVKDHSKAKGKKAKGFKTNCFICGVELNDTTAKKSPVEGDTRYYCDAHWKKRFGTKKKLVKRY